MRCARSRSAPTIFIQKPIDHRSAADDRRPRRPDVRPRGRKPPPDRRRHRLADRRHHRHQPRNVAGAAQDRKDRADRRGGAVARRKRHRQGTARPRDPSSSAARANGPFVAINCAAIPRPCSKASCSATKKAPSPARCEQNIGRIESAHGGTLFLDEIGDVPLADAGQAAALSAGPDRRADRRPPPGPGRCADRLRDQSGSGPDDRPKAASARICTTGSTRSRSGFPPLRERPADDSRLLASFFLRRFAAEYGRASARPCRLRPCARSGTIRGPAMSANSKTGSNAPW